MDIFEGISQYFSSLFLLMVWVVPFVVSLYLARHRARIFYLFAWGCLSRMFYFAWALSGIWSTHFAALTFNRASSVVAAAFFFFFLLGVAHTNERNDNGP